MSKIKILTKNYLNIFIGSIKWRKRKGKIVAAGSMVILGGVALVALMFYQAYVIYSVGSGELGLMNGTTLILLLVILTTITRSLTPNKSNDTDLLLSMPIKKSEIVISYSVSKYIFELIPVLTFFVPYAVLYLIMVEFTVLSLLGTLIVIFLIPLLSLGTSYILSTIINAIGGKFRSSNIIKIVITLIFVFGLMFIFSSSGTNLGMMEKIYPAVWMTNIIISFDLLSLMYFLLLIFVPFIIGVFLFSKSFGIPKAKYVSSNKELKFKQRHPLRSLLIKEGKRYLSSPIYVINTIIGPIFIIGFTIYSIVANQTINNLLNQLEAYKPYIVLIAFIWFISMTAVSTSSISLEGKNIWILKAHPISPKDIFLAKAGFNILLVAPVSVIAIIILKFMLDLNVFQAIILIIIVVVVSIFTGLSGLLFNLWFPKMEWNNEMAVVKQSMSVFISVLVAMLLPIIILIPVFIMGSSLSFDVYGLIIALFYVILNVLVWKLLMNKGVNAFNQL